MNRDKLKLVSYYVGIGFGIILLVAFFTSQIFMPIFFGRSKSIEVPNLDKLSATQSIKLLIDHKLHAVVKDSTWSETVQFGYVISQKPEAGTFMKPDGTVYMIVSKGSKTVTVPEVVGLNVQSAWILLKTAGLKYTIADSIYSDLYPVNTVVLAAPEAGDKVVRKSKIKLYISKGSSNAPDTTANNSDVNY
jgi:eukaryotic-like serine/threonine-protein kinase